MKKLVAGLCGLAVSFAACASDEVTAAERVRGAIRRTESQPRAFVYQDEDLERAVTVRGVLHDDYRYRARLSIDGVEVLDEVAIDDAVAVRLLRPDALQRVIPGARAGPAVQALSSGRWVVDRSGAPEITSPELAQRRIGTDPVLDALTAFAYVERGLREAAGVSLFNPDALDYVAREDKFPKPEDGSPVLRYDVKAPPIPPFTTSAGGTLPDVRHFRRMSVYVKDGSILQAMEEIDIATRFERLTEAMRLKIPARLQGARRLAYAVEALNALRANRGTEPVRIRRMSFEVVDAGKDVAVSLPPDAVNGNLNVLPNRGRRANA